MGERKVLNKYYPPNFDPSLIPRNKKPKTKQITIRTMLPFTIQCSKCAEYMYAGRKFNARKEEALDLTYLTIKIWRFYIRCTMCSSEVIFRTDPQHGGYVCEAGAKTLHDPMRDNNPWLGVEDLDKPVDKDTTEDPIGLLEQRQLEEQREMEQLQRLALLKEKSDRGSVAAVRLEYRHEIPRATAEEEALQEDQEVAAVFGDKTAGNIVRRVGDDNIQDRVNSLVLASTSRKRPRPKLKVKIRPKTAAE